MGHGSGLDGCGKSLPPIENRFPDRPAPSESLYRLSYPGPTVVFMFFVKFVDEFLQIFKI